MLNKRILEDLKKAVEDLGYQSDDIVLSIPKNSAFGDYTTNVALQLAKQKSDDNQQSPEEIANQIVKKMLSFDFAQDNFSEIKVAGGGFINFFLQPNTLLTSLHQVCDYSSLVNPEMEVDDPSTSSGQGKKILIEYASFNALKPVHVGHMRNITLGESITRLLETQGNNIFRVTYTSDIGLPSAKVIWALINSPKEFKKAKDKSLIEKTEFLGQMYVKGNSVYEADEKARNEIKEINTKIYERDKKLVKIWQEALSWTFEYFKFIYDLMGTKFDKEFLESEVEGPGKKLVLEHLGDVFFESDGAIIFKGGDYGLHNRVFISSAGNPTYEAKDMALAEVQYNSFPFDQAIHVVANDQDDYFKVIFKALEQLNPSLAAKEMHLSYGYVLLPSGKMSSRRGNVVTLDEIYDQIKEKVEEIVKKSENLKKEEGEEVTKLVSMGALKFSILKYAPNTDIIFDLEKSVSLQGDSGPYIQYTYARAKSVLRHAQYDYDVELPHSDSHPKNISRELEKEERLILQKIEHFQSIVEDAASSMHPNVVATYLLEMSSLFNLFYQKYPIIKAEEKSQVRLALTCCVAVILKQGLNLLGIEVPERM